MFLYFILLKKVTWMLEKKCVPLHIYVSNIARYVTFFSYLTCLSKYGKNIFELIGFKFKVSSKNVYVFEEKKVTRNKNFSKPTLIRVREREVCESLVGNITWCFSSQHLNYD